VFWRVFNPQHTYSTDTVYFRPPRFQPRLGGPPGGGGGGGVGEGGGALPFLELRIGTLTLHNFTP
jgi:hypothetical protein